MGVGVEVLDRQGLHAVEHVVAHVLEGALRDHGHDPRVQQAREHAEGVDGAHHGDDPHEHGHDGAESHAQPGGDDLVDDPLHEDRGDRRGDGGDDDADGHDDQPPRVVAEHVGQQASGGVLDAGQVVRLMVLISRAVQLSDFLADLRLCRK